MIVLPPFQLTDATLISSDVPETDEAEWAGGSFSIGQKVMVTTPDIHLRFESLTNSNATNPVTDQLTGGSNWLNLGATNRHAMFDALNGTQTIQADKIEVEIATGQITNMVALLNCSAAEVQVLVIDPTEGEVYNRTVSLISDSGINDWYGYYFTPIERKMTLVLTDLPAYANATVKVIATDSGNDVAIGVLAVGIQVSIGVALHGTGASAQSYSRKEVDDFGNFIVVKRPISKRADYAIRMPTGRTAFVQNLLAELDTVPCIWVGDEGNGATVVYGYYRDFEIILSDAVYSDASLQVEGLT